MRRGGRCAAAFHTSSNVTSALCHLKGRAAQAQKSSAILSNHLLATSKIKAESEFTPDVMNHADILKRTMLMNG